MTPEDIKRYEWLCSQRDWHGAQAHTTTIWKSKCWHYSQAEYYRRQIRKLPGLFTWIVSETLRNQPTRLLTNITRNNALLQRITRGTKPL